MLKVEEVVNCPEGSHIFLISKLAGMVKLRFGVTKSLLCKFKIAANDRVRHNRSSGAAEATAGAGQAGQVHQPVEHCEKLHRKRPHQNTRPSQLLRAALFPSGKSNLYKCNI